RAVHRFSFRFSGGNYFRNDTPNRCPERYEGKISAMLQKCKRCVKRFFSSAIARRIALRFVAGDEFGGCLITNSVAPRACSEQASHNVAMRFPLFLGNKSTRFPQGQVRIRWAWRKKVWLPVEARSQVLHLS